MKKFILINLVLLISFFKIDAQYKMPTINEAIALEKKIDTKSRHSQTISVELFSESNNSSEVLWNRKLKNLEKGHKLPLEAEIEIKNKTQLKLKNLKEFYLDRQLTSKTNASPILGTNFSGNEFEGYTPPDNYLAISNDEIIVSVSNSSIFYYKPNGTKLFESSFDDFVNNSSLNATFFDPRVIYDSEADRFILVFLHGNSPAESKVILCFSKTNNPIDGWWIYTLSGDLLDTPSWFDYPSLGISTDDVFITGNLFSPLGDFKESIIYQVDKSLGYSGATINSSFWDSISEEPFSLVPISYGHQGSYGSGIYLITNKKYTLVDKFLLYEITNNLSSGNATMNNYTINIDSSYSLAGNALQSGSSVQLDNGDNKIQSAFYLNGIIHFVFNSEYINGYNGINYSRLKLADLSYESFLFGQDGSDYSYPTVASYSNSIEDKTVMIGFLKSNSSIFPQFKAVECDSLGNFSNSILVKEGETFVSHLEVGNKTRWGDYSGIARKHNATSPEVWISGSYGRSVGVSKNYFDTWVAEIGNTVYEPEPSTLNEYIEDKEKVTIFPNPIVNTFKIDFEIEKTQFIKIQIFNSIGKEIKLLFKDIAKKGQNVFTFNKGILPQGAYIITIKTDDKTLANEKIIIE